MKKKKTNTTFIISGVIVLAAVLMLAGFYVYYKVNPQKEYFILWTKNLATNLYGEITGWDLVNEYPESAADVMEYYNKIDLLIYGELLINDELLPELAKKQEMFFSDSLLAANTGGTHLAHVETTFSEFREFGLKCYEMQNEKPVQNPDDENLVVVPVMWQTNKMGEIWWNYTLEKDGAGKYKILGFERGAAP